MLSVAPEKIGASAVFCAADRQVPSRPAVQVGTSRVRLKAFWQALVSCTMPSVAPSSASHFASTALETTLRSAAVKPVEMSAGLVATEAYCLAPKMLAMAASGRR